MYKFTEKLGLNDRAVMTQTKLKREKKDEYSIKRELIKYKLREELKKYKHK